MDTIESFEKDKLAPVAVGDDLPPGYVPKYFHEWEFRCAEPSCHLSDMDEQLLHQLDDAREIAGIPMHVNSAFRSVDWEKLHHRDGSSSHTKGKAIDIRCTDSSQRARMLLGFVLAGFRRIGIYARFIHVDVDQSKPNAVWLG